MNPSAIFVVIIAAAGGFASLVATLYFARSTLRHIYPELRARPNVLRHPVQAFWRTDCLTPSGREAHRRVIVFASIATTTLAVAAWLSLQLDLLSLIR